jgi:putative Mg2+ transporter-C (MgtC) family protein
MLVARGSALFVLIPAQGESDMEDVTRVIQGIATGIGFIGAGSILELPDERRIEGLTTASAVWVTASAGVAAGLGFLGPAVLGVAFSWLVLGIIGRLERRVSGSPRAGDER